MQGLEMAQNVDGPYEQSLDSGATCLSSSSNQGPRFEQSTIWSTEDLQTESHLFGTTFYSGYIDELTRKK